MKTKILTDFQICISVPLSELSICYLQLKCESSFLRIYYCSKSPHRQGLFNKLATQNTVELLLLMKLLFLLFRASTL